MQVKLKVIGGKNDGREIRISVPEFVIGRGEEAHLRPSSDLVSRHHCALKLENGSVVISDLGSRNGTFVNGEKIESPHVARVGDTLRIGRLQFEVLIDHVQPSNKKPKIQGVAEAAARTATNNNANGDVNDESITDWLSQPGDDDLETRSLTETQHFSLDDTPTKMFVRSDEISESSISDVQEESSSSSKSSKKTPKKLPFRPNSKSESSKSAADEVLRKFFNRR